MKEWYQSRTVWSAVLKQVAGVLTISASFLDGEISTENLVVGAAALVWGIADLIIRFKTDTAVRLAGKDK